MAKKLKVYGGNFHLRGKQVHGVIAGTQNQAADATGAGLSYIRNYWCETGNATALEVALKEPGVLFWCENNHASKPVYMRVEKEQKADDQSPNQ